VPEQQYEWSRKSLDELEALYHREIVPMLRRAEGIDAVRERPTTAQLDAHGFSGLAYALREHHDMTVGEFLTDVVGHDETDTTGYDWGIDDETTVDRLDAHLRAAQSTLQDLSDATVASRRSRLATYAQAYQDLHGTAALVDGVADLDDQPREIQRVLAVFEALFEDLAPASQQKYVQTVDGFYRFLLNRGYAAFNPLANADDEFNFETDHDARKVMLDADHVSTIYGAAKTAAERVLVLALCGWGLRRSEVASLHVSQLVLEGDDPHVAFDERKNGPGEVSLLYGRDAAEDLIIERGEGREWNGYLFPSRAASAGHITPETAANRFKRLCDRADVTVAGETPTPHAGRRFWYETYSAATEAVAEQLSFVADEQGSADASVVEREYVSDGKLRKLRRERMQERLQEAFEKNGGEE